MTTQRRTLSNAISMSDEVQAFIGGGAAKAPTPRPKRTPELAAPKAEAGALPDNAAEAEQPHSSGAVARPPARRKREEAPVAAEPAFHGELLVPLTTRIRPATANALRRALLEQKLRHAKPATQQEIVEEALAAWLEKQARARDASA